MLKSVYEKRYNQLIAKIENLSGKKLGPVAQFSAIMEETRICLIWLKEEIILHPFADELEEIHFFKFVKPKFLGLQIFYKKRFSVLQSRPIGGKKAVNKYLEAEIVQLQRWFHRHQYYYQYQMLGATEFDARYFMRRAPLPEVWVDQPIEMDPDFCTPLDGLFAKIIAYELLLKYLNEELQKINGETSSDIAAPVLPKLVWTGEMVNLVEVIYGIYYTGQLNHSNVEVKEIIALMELVFGIELKAAYHKFGDIRRRKSISPVKFLDRMREAILQRIDEDLAYKPNRGIKLMNDRPRD